MPDYQTPQSIDEVAAELQNVSSSDTVVTAGNKEYLPVSPDYKNQIPQSIDEVGAAGDAQSLVGRVLRSIKGFDKGATDWVETHSGNFLKTASGWFVMLSEIGIWYELVDAIA